MILSGSFIVYSKKILLFKDFLSLEILGKKKLVHSLTKGEPKSKSDVGESLGINFFTIEFMEKYYNFLSHFLHENQEINWEMRQKMEEMQQQLHALEGGKTINYES